MKVSVLAATAVLASSLATGCVVSVDSQGQIVRDEKRFTVDGVPVVHATTFDGSITVQSWDRADVLVEIEKRGPTREAVDGLQVTASQDGNRIDVEVKRPRTESFTGIGFQISTSARLVVSVPRRADVVARSGDGSIRVERVNGKLELRTGDGSIRATDVSGDIALNTGDGSVTVEGADGKVQVETGDGGVSVSGKLNAVRMHTGDGSIVCRAQPGSAMAQDWDISTGDGGVAIYLPPDFNAELDAHTGDGRITNELSVEAPGREDSERNRRTVRGRLGDGGKLLRIRSGDGAIRLRAS